MFRFTPPIKTLVLLLIVLALGFILAIRQMTSSTAKTLAEKPADNRIVISSQCPLKLGKNAQVISEEKLWQIQIYPYGNFSKLNKESDAIYDPTHPNRGSVYKTGGFLVPNPIKSLANSYFSEGLIAEKAYVNEYHQKVGFIDKKGRFIIKPSYSSASKFSGGLAFVEIDGKYGFINRSGQLAIPLKFEQVRDFSEGLAPVKLNNKWGFINVDGKMNIPPKFQDIRFGVDFDLYKFSEGLAAVLINNKVGYIDPEGHMSIPPKFDRGNKFSEGLAAVEVERKGRGFINALGDMVIQPKFYEAKDFSEGLAAVAIDSQTPRKYGFVNVMGDMVISPQFDYVEKFSEGLAAVRVNDRWGYIDYSGRIVVPLVFAGADSFLEGIGGVSLNDYKAKQPQSLESGEVVSGFIMHWDVVRQLQQCDLQN